MANSRISDEWKFALGDSEPVLVPDQTEQDVEDLSVDHYSILKKEAMTAQRLAVCRNADNHIKGCAAIPTYDPERKMTDEKMFRVSGLIRWLDGKPDAVVDALKRGRTRARVSAAMGVGKSTLLPLYVADQMDHRVLYVTLYSTAYYPNKDWTAATGMGRFRETWSTKVRSWVCGMTYDDFNVQCRMIKRSDLFKHFETIIFDEAFVKTPAVQAALKQFAVLSGPNTNLLLCSANIEEGAEGAQVESGKMGNVIKLKTFVSIDEAIQSGKLVSTYLCDRSVVLVPNDDRVYDVGEYYRSQGVDVKMLDSAARQDEVNAVNMWMSGDSSTPRVLVGHVKFGITYNFQVAYVILWPQKTIHEIVGDTLVHKEVALTESMVGQGISRAGRGLTDSAKALVMGTDYAPEDYYPDCYKFQEFVLLVASYIRPLRNGPLGSVYEKLPNGLNARTAQLVLKVNLPVEVVMRYLAADGLVASKYSKALQVFSQVDHYMYASEHELPVGYDKWVEEMVVSDAETDEFVKVPLHADGEIKVVLQAISAIAEGKFTFERWRLPTYEVADFDDLSDSESRYPTSPARRLRTVRSIPKIETVAPSPSQEGWTYAAVAANVALGGARTREAVVVDKTRMLEAINYTIGLVNDFKFIEGPLVPTPTAGGEVAELELPPGEVDTPNGSRLCQLSGRLCRSLNTGVLMSVDELKELVQTFRVHGNRLVTSRLFDAMGKAWTSVLLSFNDEHCVDSLLDSGLSTFAYDFLGYLGGRFSFELTAAVKNSNVYKTRYMGLFKRPPTTEEMMQAIRHGKFTGLAQSERFLQRVINLKSALDQALVFAEMKGVYLPFMITDAQRTLPIHARTAIGRVGDGDIVATKDTGRHKHSASREWRRKMKAVSNRRDSSEWA